MEILRFKLSIFFIWFFVLVGCSFVRSEVSVFHKLPSSIRGTKYAFIRLKEQQHNLEHENYEGVIRTQLRLKGFIETDRADADMLVGFFYGIGGSGQETGAVPIFGQTGVSSATTYGNVQSFGGMSTYSGTTTYTPSYGIVGAIPYSRNIYLRYFQLHIFKKRKSEDEVLQKLYEGKVNSSGPSNQIGAILPAMVKALFENFPGKSGSTKRTLNLLK